MAQNLMPESIRNHKNVGNRHKKNDAEFGYRVKMAVKMILGSRRHRFISLSWLNPQMCGIWLEWKI